MERICGRPLRKRLGAMSARLAFSLFLTLLIASGARAQAVAPSNAEVQRLADSVGTEAQRISERGRVIFYVWANDRSDALTALYIQDACANHRWAMSFSEGDVARREALDEIAQQADRAILDMQSILFAHALEETRAESVRISTLIAFEASEAYGIYRRGFENAVIRTWYSDPTDFERTCATR